MVRGGPLRGGIGVKGLLTGTLQLAEITCSLNPACQLGAGLRRIIHLLCVNKTLLCRNRFDPGLTNLRNLIDHALLVKRSCAVQSGVVLFAIALRQGQQVKQAE
jgi:hypothetical protein